MTGLDQIVELDPEVIWSTPQPGAYRATLFDSHPTHSRLGSANEVHIIALRPLPRFMEQLPKIHFR
jgi:hypothetical protein